MGWLDESHVKHLSVFTYFEFFIDIGLEECIQSRPPLKIDLSGPKPTTYDPPAYLPWETTSPAYTMRPKTQPEKGINYLPITKI